MMPFFKFDYFGMDTGLLFAFIIGIGFGWFLERAGFGSAKKLAAQFYFTDLTVFKVMFTAIVTAMTGVYFLSSLGFMDITMITVIDTYIMPQIIGGLLLGVGFVIGGYCPGTSMVACATGKIDAVYFVLGVFLGTFIYGEIFPFIENFANATHIGKVLMPNFLNIPYGVLVFAVILMALGGFAGAEWVEKKFGYKKAEALNEN